jgi:hypothetical protein
VLDVKEWIWQEGKIVGRMGKRREGKENLGYV